MPVDAHPDAAPAPRATEVELVRVDLPLVARFRAAHGAVEARDVLLVRVGTDVGDGWAECVAPVEPTYTAEHVAGAALVVAEHLAPRLLASGTAALDAVAGHPMAKAALRTAVLDAVLQARGRSLAGHLGATRSRVPAGVAVGMAPTIDALIDEVGERVAAGYRRVKLKIAPGWDVEPVAAVRGAHPDLALQVDANGSYDPAVAEALVALDRHGVVLVEQPFAADDLAAHVDLAARIATPICLDESITSARTARLAIDLGACTVVNVKAGRVGGLDEARAIHDLCVERAVDAWVGGMHETGLGRAEALALAALPGFTLPPDLSASDRYYARDVVTRPFVLDADGCLTVPDGPGLGVDLDLDLIDDLATGRTVVRR